MTSIQTNYSLFIQGKDHEKYRPDIDGLRAIAVLLVIAGHYFPEKFPRGLSCGFIGVDVFFVISGYLISSIIFTKLIQGSFTFSDFYVRRIKRIFPALLIVTFFISAAIWYTSVSSELPTALGEPLLSTTLFFRNIQLAHTSFSYFNSSLYDPFLHLWSLAVEEQFYIFYPIILYVLYKLFFKKPSIIFVLIALFFFCSFFWNTYLVQFKPIEGYYLLSSRAWELLGGSLIAYVVVHKKNLFSYVSTKYAFLFLLFQNAISFLALSTLVALSFGFVDIKSHYPGVWGLAPMLATVAIILTPRSLINKYMLSNKLLLVFGLISYSLYLWHWPLLVAAQIIISPQPSIAWRMGCILLSVLFSMVSTIFIENPIRKKGSKTVILLILGMVIALVISLGILSKKIHSYIAYKSPILAQKIQSSIDDWNYPSKFDNPNSLNSLDFRRFPFPSFGQGKKIIVFFGDSVIEQYWARVEKIMKDSSLLSQQYTVVFITRRGQPPILGTESDQETTAFFSKAVNFLDAQKIESVVLGAKWWPYLTGHNPQIVTRNKLSLENMILHLKDKNIKVYIVLGNPMSLNQGPKSLIQHGESIKSYPLEMSLSKESNDYIRKLVKKTNALLIDSDSVLCPSGRCIVLDKNNNPIYKDPVHVRASFIREQANYIDRIFNQSF